MFQIHNQSQGRTLTAVALLLNLLCGSSIIQISMANLPQEGLPTPPGAAASNGGGGGSTNSERMNSASVNNLNSNYNNVNNGGGIGASQTPPVPQQNQPPPVPSEHTGRAASSLSTTPVRAVSTRPSSDISTTSTSDSDNSVPSHYDACPNAEPWCSSLDENEKLALEAIHALHHQLDDDKNGNIDLSESDEFLREELKYDKDYQKRQENFHRNNDNQVSVRELWETWVRSEVHNWTADQTAEWIGIFVGLPHYHEKFIKLEINGTYLPRLAVNHHNFLTTNLGIKDVITRQKLTLKAQDVVLFGPPRDNTNHTKDAILTTLLVVAVTVCYLVYCRYKSSQRDLGRMAKDMEALMKAEEALRDLQKEMELAKCDQEVRDKEAVTHRNSSDDEDELIKLRSEVVVLRNELQRAEVELQDKCWVPPPALTHWLQLTYELESKAHNKKRQAAEKQLKQAKEACDKLKKKRSSLMGAFVATHARSIDDVDKAILEARAALTEVTQELQERMHRWKQIEMLVKSPIVNNPGLASLEILLRTGGRSNPYLGAGSVMSNSQDDIDDDGASSIYCPSAVHKLVSTSAFMMFPGGAPASYSSATLQQQQSSSRNSYQQSSDYSSITNFGGCGGLDSVRPSQSPDISGRERDSLSRVNNNHSSLTTASQSYQSDNYSTDFTDCNEVSGPISSVHHAPIARSKSVQSMLSLRERGYTRESSSKDSSNGEDDILMDPTEMSAKDRRVTFRNSAADRRSGQLRSLQMRGNGGPLFEPMEFEEVRNYSSRKPLSTSRLDSSKSSDEDSERKLQSKEQPDLIKVPISSVDGGGGKETNKLSNNSSFEQHQNNHHHHHHNHHYNHQGDHNAIAKINAELLNISEDPFEFEATNVSMLNNHGMEKSSNNNHTAEELNSNSAPPPPKLSLFKTISKIMRIQSDGLSSKKSKGKIAKDNSQPFYEDNERPYSGGGGKSSTLGNGTITNSRNNLIIEKNLKPNQNHSNHEEPIANGKVKNKSQKKERKFFSLPRRKPASVPEEVEVI